MSKQEATVATVNKPTTPTPSEVASFVPHHEDPFLSFADCGLLVGKTRNTIRNWVESGLLRAVREPGGGRRIRKSEIVRVYGASALAETRPLPLDAVDPGND